VADNEREPMPPEVRETFRRRVETLRRLLAAKADDLFDLDDVTEALDTTTPAGAELGPVVGQFLALEVNREGEVDYASEDTRADLAVFLLDRTADHAEHSDPYDDQDDGWSLRVFDLDAGVELAWSTRTVVVWNDG
jgi:hypothetical protein